MNDIKMLYDAYLAAEKNRVTVEVAYHTADDVATAAESAYDSARIIYYASSAAYNDAKRAAEEAIDAAELVYHTADDAATDAEQSFDIAKNTYKTACEDALYASKAYQLALSDKVCRDLKVERRAEVARTKIVEKWRADNPESII